MIENNDNRKQTIVDEDIARMQSDFKMGRFTSDFDGMDSMTVLKRVEYIRRSLHEDIKRLPENANRLVNDVITECDCEEYFPNVHLICEKMTEGSKKRFEKAESTFVFAQSSVSVRPGKKAIRMRRTIDAKYEAVVSKRLLEERKKIDAQKKEMEQYIKMAPYSSYAAMIVNIMKQNEEGYQLTSKYLDSQVAVEKYEQYEKIGVIVEEEKKLCVLANEMEQAAELRITNHKQSAYILQERDALLRFDNKQLMKEAHAGLLNCEKKSLAFIEIPKEMSERLLEHGLMECERKYYQALRDKQNLVGFHPFRNTALKREIQRTAKEYNAGRLLLLNHPENKWRHPPLTTLEEWEKQSAVPVEKIEETDGEIFPEIPVEEIVEELPRTKPPVQMDLSEQIRKQKTVEEPVKEAPTEKVMEQEKAREEQDIER